MPFIFVVLLSLVFGPKKGTIQPQVRLLIEDHDNSIVSRLLTGAFGQGELKNLFVTQSIEKDKGLPLIEDGKASALLIIPKNFGQVVFQDSTELILIKNPSEAFAPKIADETVRIVSEGMDRLVKIAKDPLHILKGELDKDTFEDDKIAEISIQTNRLMKKTATYLFPPLVSIKEIEVNIGEAQYSSSHFYAYFLTGIIAMFLLFILNNLSVDIYKEIENFTLYRILVSPVKINDYISAKQIFLVLAGILISFVVWIFSFIVFKIHIPQQTILPFVLINILIALTSSGIISLIHAILRTRTQVSAIAPAIIIFLSMAGGSMIPLDSMPGFMKQIAVISPVFWGVDGMQKILIDNQPLSQIPIHLFVLIILTLILNSLAFAFFRRKFSL